MLANYFHEKYIDRFSLYSSMYILISSAYGYVLFILDALLFIEMSKTVIILK